MAEQGIHTMLTIKNCSLIDGNGNFEEDVSILIENNKIKEIGSPEERGRIIDAKGKYVLPGLIDSHLHLAGTRSMNPLDWVLENSALKTIRAVKDVEKLIEAGFTSVRCAGISPHSLALRDAVNEGIIKGPRIQAAGRVMSQTGGHGDFHMLPLEWAKKAEMSCIVDGVDECRKAARELLREGVDFIKMCTTGGVLSEKDSPEQAQFTVEEIKAVVEEAERVNKKVDTHSQGTEGIRNAVKAGVKNIVHGFYLDKKTCRMMIENNCVYIPTLSVNYKLFTEGKDFDVPEYGLKKIKKTSEIHKESIALAYKMGVTIATGTDFIGPELLPHGDNALELELLVEKIGFTEMEAITAATKNGAITMGRNDLGTIEEGKTADMIIVNKNPLENIKILREKKNIECVIKNGAII
ncbi:MAG TPA: amidohydrolase family protein [Euryarchaeota archaeon]|nr:amidohydrolase family protein [Euryarchaeota archaeon]